MRPSARAGHRPGRRAVAASLAWALLALVAALPGPARSADDGYTLGIFPYMAARQTVALYGPVARSMSAALGRPVRLVSEPSFPDFERNLDERRYDIALVQPFDYLRATQQLGYVPLAQLSVPLVTQIYVRDDSPAQRIGDLRGTTVAMPPPQTANARMALRALLDHRLQPGQDVELRYLASHDACLQQVWTRLAMACASAVPPVRIFEQRMQAHFRPIHATPPLPHIVFMARDRVPAAERATLQALIVGWRDSDEGRALLAGLGFPGWAPPRPADYEVMRGFDTGQPPADTGRPLGPRLTFGVIPYLHSRLLVDKFAKALPRLADAAGRPVQLRTAAGFGPFLEGVTRRAYDLVLVQPFDYAVARQSGYLPVAGMAELAQGTFLVRDDSPVRRIEDLRGMTVALPPAGSAQSRLALRTLGEAGLVAGRDLQVTHLPTHDACLRQVQQRRAAACATSPTMLSMVPPAVATGLHGIGTTETIPGLLIMAQQRVPEDMRRRLAEEIVGWPRSEAGRAVLADIGLGPFGAVDTARYEQLSRDEGSR